MPVRVGQQVQALPRAPRLIRRGVLAAALALAAVPAAAEGPVTLAAPDGAFSVSGTLLGFDGAWWRIETAYGALTLDAAAIACSGAGCPQPGVQRLAISGEGAIGQAVLPALIEAHARAEGLEARRESPDADHDVWTLTAPDGEALRVAVRHTTTAEGFADMVADEADLVIALRPARPHEGALVEDAGLGDLDGPRRARVLGVDAMVPIVSPQAGAAPLTLPALAELFSGRGPDPDAPPPRLHLPVARSGLAQAFEDAVMAPAGLRVGEAERHADPAALARAVAADPGAVGIVRRGEVGPAAALPLVGACGEPLASGPLGARSGDDPLALPVLLYLPPRRLPPMARSLAASLVAPEAGGAVAAAGLLDRAPERTPLAAQGLRLVRAIAAAGDGVGLSDLQRLAASLSGRERLTTTIRFGDGGAGLGAVGRDDVLRLARRIAEGELAGRSLLLAGFSDAQGPAARNRRLSALRAEAVRAAILDALADLGAPETPEMIAEGFGEAAPLACDDTPWGRRVNRRVEIWVG